MKIKLKRREQEFVFLNHPRALQRYISIVLVLLALYSRGNGIFISVLRVPLRPRACTRRPTRFRPIFHGLRISRGNFQSVHPRGRDR